MMISVKTRISLLWEKFPKEIKVGFYVVGSAALAELIKYLKIVEVDSLLLAAVINIVVVCLQTRVPRLRERLRGK